MAMKTLVASAMCLACAVLQAGAAQSNPVRVYPTPKRLEMAGGVSSAKLNDAKVRKVEGLGEEGYRIVVGKDAITVEASTKAGGF